MATTVIDKLLIELGIDAKGFKSGMDDSLKTLKTAETVTDRTNKKSKKHQKEQGKVTKDHIKDLKAENKELGSIGKTLGTIGKGFVAYQALSKSFSAFKEITDESSKIERFSKSLNLSASQTQAFSNILTNIGGNGQEVINTVAGLQNALNSLQFEGETSGVRGLSILGISPVELDGTRKSANQLLNDIRDGLKAVDDPNRRNWIAQQLGIGPDLLYAMSQSDAEWKKQNENAERQSKILDELGPKAQNFTKAWSTFFNDLKSGGFELIDKVLSTDIGEGFTYGLEHGLEELKAAKDQFTKENSGTIDAIKSGFDSASNWVSGKVSSTKDDVMKNIGDWSKSASEKYGVSSGLIQRLIKQESGFNPNAVNKKTGATGLGQFMPGTAKQYGVDVKDPSSSVEGIGHYLSDLLKMFGGDTSKALAGYNWGQGNVMKAVKKHGSDWLSHAPKETQDYVRNITSGNAYANSINQPKDENKNAYLNSISHPKDENKNAYLNSISHPKDENKNAYLNSISQPLSQAGQSQSPASATTISVDKVTINTQATDAKAIKQEFSGRMTAQADAGMM